MVVRCGFDSDAGGTRSGRGGRRRPRAPRPSSASGPGLRRRFLYGHERARAAVAGIALPVGDATIRATTSLGVAVLPRHARTRDELIAAADQAAYAAKDAGKDCVRPSGEPPRLTLVSPA